MADGDGVVLEMLEIAIDVEVESATNELVGDGASVVADVGMVNGGIVDVGWSARILDETASGVIEEERLSGAEAMVDS